MNKPKGQAEWLKDIEPDQNVIGINTLDETRKDEAGRKYFVSQVLQPGIEFGRYDRNTGKYTLSQYNAMVVSQNVAAQAALTLTNPTTSGVFYRVHVAGIMNSTRLSARVLSGTIGGTAITSLAYQGAGLQSRTDILLGSAGPTSTTISSGIAGPIILSPGDSLTLTDGSFVAGDSMLHFFIYEVV